MSYFEKRAEGWATEDQALAYARNSSLQLSWATSLIEEMIKLKGGSDYLCSGLW